MKKTILLIVMAMLCTFFCTKTQTTYHLMGVVKDEKGLPLPGTSIRIKESNIKTSSDKDGKFAISVPSLNITLQFSFIGYQPEDYIIKSASKAIEIKLKPDDNSLNEIQIIGYGTTTKRLNTGSISTITAKQIEQQPVTNILSALSGRMPGVFIQTTNGLPGGNINVQIRGKGSIAAGTNPLYIVDGVPFESGNYEFALTTSPVNGVINPLNSINPSDIENISILKDADATAIYGSRGSNGVVLITTKKGKTGVTRANINITQGINKLSIQPKLLNTQQYLQIRKEAFENDGLTPTTVNAPDLLIWDQHQDTNWLKYLVGNIASYTDLQTSISGGNTNTTFQSSAGFHRENNIISNKAQYMRGSFHLNLNHKSTNQRFEIQLSNYLTIDDNKSPNLENASSGVLLAPNFPSTDAQGLPTLWTGNPVKDLLASTNSQTNTLRNNIEMSYSVFKSLKLKLSGGYNKTNIDQQKLFPLLSLYASPNYAQYIQNFNQSAIIEPQISYITKLGKGNLLALIGGTYQTRITKGQSIKASGFSNEQLMENLSSASNIDARANSYTQYKYISLFARATYNLLDKYIFNATVRKDGSSRFGSGSQFGAFGSLSTAWLFSEEEWFKTLSLISFGKLRVSYGSTGNDQISDYQFLSTSSSSGRSYEGLSTLKPSRIDNTKFHWETTHKMEFAIELGLIKNSILLNVNYYHNRSKDQLVQYALPTITGFSSYQANLPAVVQNTGLEFDLNLKNYSNKNFSWNTTFNLSIPHNKLVSFQNFESSSYAQTYKIGYDISRIKGYQFLGVDPQTGSAQYADVNGEFSNNVSAYNQNFSIGKSSPDFYGGIGNSLTYKNFSLDLFLQFSAQHSIGGISYSLGQLSNSFAFVNARWTHPGMHTNIPKPSTIGDFYYPSSSANYFNSSYLRLKNISIGYEFPKHITQKVKVEYLNLFLRGQNVFTFWNKNIPLLDPESGALTAGQPNISPGSSLVIGLNLTF